MSGGIYLERDGQLIALNETPYVTTSDPIGWTTHDLRDRLAGWLDELASSKEAAV